MWLYVDRFGGGWVCLFACHFVDVLKSQRFFEVCRSQGVSHPSVFVWLLGDGWGGGREGGVDGGRGVIVSSCVQ